ncbi:hypothetical protein [Saccharophagus degradans]|uniref:hypothetical protein n=1 Tax=Saccharophagus degradans TaxID=86304 RepID=UPI00031A4AD1|nr:hypothetical protein [Saccharophagus degradans]MBU2986006.1 hypothetical protein [Saccharophagus degradans]WGO97199.1 hypothetical protein QFX18_14230 [Saccharophagus degradans]
MRQPNLVFLALSPDALARLLDTKQLDIEEFRCLDGYTKAQVKGIFLRRLRKHIHRSNDQL